MVLTADYKTAENYLQMLYTLSKEARLYVLSKLTDSLLKEEVQTKLSEPTRRSRAVRRSSSQEMTDAQLEALFADKPMPDSPVSEPTWEEVIRSNSGKTIKPVEKWL